MGALKRVSSSSISPLPNGWIRPSGPDTIPAGAGAFSDLVFLAMPGGEVKIGHCLYRPHNATYREPVHAWFALEEGGGFYQLAADPIAWRPFQLPQHPLEG